MEKIDYDALLDEFLPRIEEAEKNGDKAEFGAIMTEFCYRFNDSHVSAYISPEFSQQVNDKLYGNDYGFSMFTIKSGETIAVNVEKESEAYKSGITEGTVITKWNGQKISEAVSQVECIGSRSFAVKSNEDYFKAIFIAGKGGEKVKVSFLDKNGKEKKITLSANGSYTERLNSTISKFLHSELTNENFYTEMISKNCGYLRITEEYYDDILDNLSVLKGGDYPQLTEFFDSKLEKLKSDGMEKLIIDLRNNKGGYNSVGGTLASLFTDKKMFMYAFGEQNGKDYKRTENLYISPNGKWKDLPVIVLVNRSTISAGDGTAYFLSQLDNVTLMGITSSGGVNQNDGGQCYLNNSDVIVNYPDYLTLGEDDKPLIDTDQTRENRIPLNVTIPVDKKSAVKIFSGKEDYELDYAKKYAEKIS